MSAADERPPLRWRIAFEFDTPNDYYATKVGDQLRDVLGGMVENVEMTADEEAS